ncbi:MAG: hypothetical protein OXQ28_13880 [Acidobacteriota bacterium]|nr:hypothetical protein [Acidobacteriota bacterium]
MSGSLDRSRITRLFGELSEELERKRVRGHVYVVGGAALIAGFGRDRSTNDVDGRIAEAKPEVLAAAARVGRRNGLPEDWLNEKAALFLPETADERAATMFNSPGLVVTGASAEHLLAMKMLAGRDVDMDDIAHLGNVLRISTGRAAARIYETVYPGMPLPGTTHQRVADALADARAERGEAPALLRLRPAGRLEGEGAEGRRYDAIERQDAVGRTVVELSVSDPAADAGEDAASGRPLGAAADPIRTVEEAARLATEYELAATGRAGGDTRPAIVLRPIEVFEAEGERNRRYEARWIGAGGTARRLEVSVVDPAAAEDDGTARRRPVPTSSGEGIGHSIAEAEAAINRYEQKAAASRR